MDSIRRTDLLAGRRKRNFWLAATRYGGHVEPGESARYQPDLQPPLQIRPRRLTVVADEAPDETVEQRSEPPPGKGGSSLSDLPKPPDLPPVPDDAADTRGHHLRRLAANPLTIGLTVVLAAIALIAVGSQVGLGIGAASAAGVLVVALVVVWLLAASRAADDFFDAYSAGRGLTRIEGKSNLPPITPLLRKGESRYAEQRFNGILPGGLEGSLCLYTYEDETRDSDGNKQTNYVRFTVVITQLPATAPFVHELFCQRRSGFRFMDSMEDVFRKRQRVEHESEAVDRKFEIFTGATDEINRARQILSPTFLIWLEGHSPEAFAFELVAGSLVTNVKGHKKSASELDPLCEATAAVARRLLEEATEVSERGPAASSPPPA